MFLPKCCKLKSWFKCINDHKQNRIDYQHDIFWKNKKQNCRSEYDLTLYDSLHPKVQVCPRQEVYDRKWTSHRNHSRWIVECFRKALWNMVLFWLLQQHTGNHTLNTNTCSSLSTITHNRTQTWWRQNLHTWKQTLALMSVGDTIFLICF